jgi:hypothetical protein
MKKVVALVLSVVMMLSVAALADTALRIVASPNGGISVVQVTVDGQVVENPTEVAKVDENSQLVQDLAAAIEEVGMNEAFGSVVENPEEYNLASLADFSVEKVDGNLVISLAVAGVKADNEVVVLLGLVAANQNVTWSNLEVVSVEDGVVSVAVTPEQAEAVSGNDAVVAVLVK